MIRTFAQKEVEDLAEYGSIPIINGLTDFCHPCQILADLMTIREHKGRLEGLKMCYIGDGNNMANSLIVGGLKVGMEVSVACPNGIPARPAGAGLCRRPTAISSLCTENILEEAAKDADVVHHRRLGLHGTGRGSRGPPEGLRRLPDQRRSSWQLAKPGAMVLHCLPAHREEEITAEVFEAHANEIFDEAENRLHAQKAVMVKLMEKK